MNDAAAVLAALLRDHDAPPDDAAAVLADLAAQGVPEPQHAAFAALVNQIIGAGQDRWPEAFDLLLRTCAASSVPCVLRNLAIAAWMSARPWQAWGYEAVLAQHARAAPAEAILSVRLGVLQYAVRRDAAAVVSRALNTCLAEATADADAGMLQAPIAAALNNIVSALLDAPDLDRTDAPSRAALREGADACRRRWRRAGSWLNHERADYLVALCRNALGEWAEAAAAARHGLDTIAANGSEDVDRAFLLLELARAQQALGYCGEAAGNRETAHEIAAAFDEPGLREWFDRRATPPP